MSADPRVERTRTKLRAALLKECESHDLGDLSAAAVVRAAGVSRAAFYLHYANVEALAVDACAEIVRDAVEALHAWRGIPSPDDPPEALAAFFVAADRHGRLYRSLLRAGGGGPLGELLHRELRERSRRERELARAANVDLIASATAASFTGLLGDWLHGLVPGTPEAVAGQVWRLLLALHTAPVPPDHR